MCGQLMGAATQVAARRRWFQRLRHKGRWLASPVKGRKHGQYWYPTNGANRVDGRVAGEPGPAAAASDGNTWPAGSWTASLQLSPAEGNDYGLALDRLHRYFVTQAGPSPNARSAEWGVYHEYHPIQHDAMATESTTSKIMSLAFVIPLIDSLNPYRCRRLCTAMKELSVIL